MEYKTIFVREGLMDHPRVQLLRKQSDGARIRTFRKFDEIEIPGETQEEKISEGKEILVVCERSTGLISRFVNKDPGAVCPSFYKMVPSTFCPTDCEYCFLQGTYRSLQPFIRNYVIDYEKLEKEICKLSTRKRACVINAGELSDPIACDAMDEMPRMVKFFSSLENVRLLLLTKTGIGEARRFSKVDHNGRTIFAWSINCREVVESFEHGTAKLESRIKAAVYLQNLGYETRLRLDPMVKISDWQKAYEQAISDVFCAGLKPSRITLGTLRYQDGLRGIMRRRFRNTHLLEGALEKNGKRWRYPSSLREEMYSHAINVIRQYDTDVPIALCKETPELNRALKSRISPGKCNCLA